MAQTLPKIANMGSYFMLCQEFNLSFWEMGHEQLECAGACYHGYLAKSV